MAGELPRLPANLRLVSPTGEPTLEFTVYWQRLLDAIEGAVADVATALQNVVDLNDLITSAETAIAAVEAATTAAQDAADAVTTAQELGTSYVSGLTLSAADAGADTTITISAHTRHYPQPDGTTTNVAVNGGSLTNRAYSTRYFVYYDDAARTGGAVTYQSTTSSTTAAQIGDRHVVGAVTTPAALGAPAAGQVTRPPGSGTIQEP